MRRRKLSHIVGTIVVLLFLFVTLATAVPPSYMPADSGYANYHTGFAEAYNSKQGLNYGKAKSEWHDWCNSTNDYLDCAYTMCNNEGGIANDRADDYAPQEFGSLDDAAEACFTVKLEPYRPGLLPDYQSTTIIELPRELLTSSIDATVYAGKSRLRGPSDLFYQFAQ